MVDLTPADIGLPSKFTSFRPDQWDAILHAVYSPKRFIVICAPTGMGKSLIARTIAILLNQRTVIVTATRGLADQYLGDFGPSITSRVARRIIPTIPIDECLLDIRGKGNYECVERTRAKYRVGCDDGPRLGCSKQPGIGCPYHSALSEARGGMCVGTNYAYWMNINKKAVFGKGTGGLAPIIGKKKPVEVLILDEAHGAREELTRFLAVRVGEKECRGVLGVDPPDTEDIDEWREWAKPWARWCKEEAQGRSALLAKMVWGGKAQTEVEEVKKIEELGKRLEGIAEVREGDWVCEEKTHPRARSRVWEFEPISPAQYAERNLFCGIPKVIMVSATIRKSSISRLGIKGHEVDFREWPRVFPKHRNQIYHYPSVRMNWRTSPDQLKIWVEAIDDIIESRIGDGRKGLIHTVSYDRQTYLMTHSRYRKLFMGNTSDPNSESAREVVGRFKKAKGPVLLVSPSFGTGWDFPGKECEFIIIAKIPFPVMKSKVMRARMKKDPHYGDAMAMQDLVQMAGRGMRFMEDRCEVFITDDSIGFFMAQNKGNAPGWFEVRRLGKGKGALPKLPPKLI